MKKTDVKHSILMTSAAILAIFVLGNFQPGFADTVKFGHVAPPFHGQAKGVDAFAGYVKEKPAAKSTLPRSRPASWAENAPWQNRFRPAPCRLRP